MKPYISIIIPIYNVEKYLDRCIQSVIQQKIKNIEIILVDDESPDNCPIICENYKSRYPNIKVIHKKNGGLGYARNSGLEVCEGEYVAFLDSDDFVSENMFKDLYEYATENNLDICYCGYYLYHNKNHIEPKINGNKPYICTSKQSIREMILDIVGSTPQDKSDVKLLSSACLGIYRQNIFKEKNIRFVSEREFIAEDFIFNINFLSECKRTGYIPKAYYYYCYNSSSLTQTYRHDRFEKELQLYNEIENILTKHGFQEYEYKNRLDRYLLLKLRSCLSQQASYISAYGYKTMYKYGMEIINSKPIKALVQRYPYQYLPCKHKVFFLLIKWKLLTLIFLLLKKKQK